MTLRSESSRTQKQEILPETFSGEQLIRIWEEDARNNLAWFIEYDGRGAWQPVPHLLLLCEKLESVERGELLRLMVFMPPRHGKSEVVSKKFPAWFLGRNPDKEIIISSYAADLAYDFSRIARNTFREWGPKLWGLNLADDSGAVGRWGIQRRRGGLVAAGVGGPITGRGAHVAIIDDPFKNYEESASETVREKVLNWYKSTLRTRLAPGGAIVLVMTRWHEKDLAGELETAMTEEDGEQWEIIELPAIAKGNDILGRQPGEPLWPARYPLTELRATQIALGSYLWSALYQQKPAPAAGNKFKRAWFRYFEIADDFAVLHTLGEEEETKRFPLNQCWCFQTCDPAASTKTSADYFVLATWLVTPHKDLLLRDVIRMRLEGPDQPKLFEQGYQRWRPKLQGVETKSMGLTLFQTLRRKGLPVIDLKAETDKETRALPVMARMEAGTVYFLRNAPWLEEYENELLVFPNGEHDDQVDVTSYAGIVIARRINIGPVDKPPGW